jgi:hypothetical protein
MKQTHTRGAPTLFVVDSGAAPPEDFQPDERAAWFEIRKKCPPGWVPSESAHLFNSLAVAVAAARRFDEQAREHRQAGRANLELRYSAAARAERNLIATLSTKLKLNVTGGKVDERRAGRLSRLHTERQGAAAVTKSDDDGDDDIPLELRASRLRASLALAKLPPIRIERVITDAQAVYRQTGDARAAFDVVMAATKPGGKK